MRFKKLPAGKFHVSDHGQGRRRPQRDDHPYLQGLRGFEAEAHAEAGPTPKPAPAADTQADADTDPHAPAPTSSLIQPGSYSGSDSTGAGYRFYVSADGTQIQDVSVTNSEPPQLHTRYQPSTTPRSTSPTSRSPRTGHSPPPRPRPAWRAVSRRRSHTRSAGVSPA